MSSISSDKKLTIAIDFDGVIHSYHDGWRDGTCYGYPIEGAFKEIETLMERFNVFILTTRSAEDTKEWMDRWLGSELDGLENPFPTEVVPNDTDNPFWDKEGVLGITNRKLVAISYIDDRALRFTNWKDMKNYFM